MRNITETVNDMTSEQYCKLIDMACPLTDEEKERFSNMSDDDLLKELGV